MKSMPKEVTFSAGPVMNAATVNPEGGVTARIAGGLRDMKWPVSPSQVPVRVALQNMAKAINIAFQHDFLENELEGVFKTARVKNGTVEIQHEEYIGLGDGIFAHIGKIGKSIELTLRGPDPGSPQGKERYQDKGRKPISGVFNVIFRKLNLLQEFEDMLPTYVEQLLDRLEGANMVVGWNREEWEITTKIVGLDVVLRPLVEPAAEPKAKKGK